MARAHAVISEDDFHIPAVALTFDGFRAWAQSEDFPETGRIDFLAGCVEAEMSPEELGTHGLVKAAIALGLGILNSERRLGHLFIDKARVSSPEAQLSVEPDLVVVFSDSLREGRTRFRSWSARNPERLTEIEGAVDLAVEVVSNSSVRKDTKILPPLYARAGVPELWIADARGKDLRFEIHTLEAGAYVRMEPDAEGWLHSPRLGVSFRLVRQPAPFVVWDFRLERRERTLV
jgi:Uma2 family endonuclease